MASFTPEQRKLFEEKNYVNVATLGKDGTPRTTAIWVDIDNDTVILNGAESRQWLANLRRDPSVALCIFDLNNPYLQVNVIGEVESITQEGGEEHIDKLSLKYGGQLYPDHRPDDPRQIVRIRANKITGTLSR